MDTMLWLLILTVVAVAWCSPSFVISAQDDTQGIADFQPQQIHLSIGETNQDIVVTWVTPSETPVSLVEFGIGNFNTRGEGSSTKFVDGGSEKRSMWIHRVLLKNLEPDTRYTYHVGSPLGWSEIFTFKTWKSGNQWPVRVAMFGDMGSLNPQSLPRLQEEVERDMYDVVIHVGDFAYDMDFENGRVGDEFMREIQPIAAYVPYMTCVGNHEQKYNFSHYRARFSMPNYQDTENLFFSWNMGPVHFISVSTESYYYMEYGMKPLSRQYDWLIKDLEEATRPEVRAEVPWIVLFGHKPMYCSNKNDNHNDCHNVDCLTRVGLPLIHAYGMEELLDKYGVDLAVWAHEHSYERLWPMFNYTVSNGTREEPYRNPKAPVHITTGSAGCDEVHSHFLPEKPDWSAFRSIDYGYTRMTAVNMTHLYWEQVSEDRNGEVIDKVWLIRDKHVAYPELRGNTV